MCVTRSKLLMTVDHRLEMSMTRSTMSVTGSIKGVQNGDAVTLRVST